MKVREVTLTCCRQVEMDDCKIYERWAADNWRVVIGESTESCYSQEAELERAYQEWLEGTD